MTSRENNNLSILKLNSRLDIEKKDLGNLRRDFKKYPN
jgi:hypothetical protein